ncbi:hypothetical protein DDE83_007953 [Stemphylium lycopersici]|uniref:Uncharacterized protein n=1 Tax=Stemphylium lycopersici TaxID=183478 RepID=A0A364MVJ6_STELY|nr:hypothetical protein DDE83_007953 [Stemphylium lycopersici]
MDIGQPTDSDGDRSDGNDDDHNDHNDDSTNRTKLKRKRNRSLLAKWCS